MAVLQSLVVTSRIALAFVGWLLLAGAQAPPRDPSPSQTAAPAASFDEITRRANEAREGGRLEEATDLYREALRLRPKWAEGWWYLGAMAYERDRARGTSTTATASPWSSRDRRRPRRSSARRSSSFPITLAPVELASVRLAANQAREALPPAETAARLAPGLFAAHFALGRALVATGALERGIAGLEAAVRLAPDIPDLYSTLSRAYAQAGRRANAERADAAFEALEKVRRAGSGQPARDPTPAPSP